MPEVLERTLIDSLPARLREDVGLTVFDSEGELVFRDGFVDSFDSRSGLTAAVDATEPRTRRVLVRERSDGGCVALSLSRATADQFGVVMELLFDADESRQQLEAELESMSMSSLALLEETAMVTDVMTELSTEDSQVGIVERGLHSLVVGAAAERGLYYRLSVSAEAEFELVVHVEYDADARKARRVVGGGPPLVPRGFLDRAANALRDSAILESVTDAWSAVAGKAGDGSPTTFAEREALAVPVSHGVGASERLLGILVLADKRTTSYSDAVRFGSHETKLASGLASMLAAVLGARMSAEYGKELEMANLIQRQILPDRPASIDGFELAGRCENSKAVGGDYFDYLPMSDGRTLCVVADVSGHNLASGMLMVSARSALRLLTAKQSSTEAVFDDLADAMFVDLHRTERFITAAGVTIRPRSTAIEVVNAGHNDTMIYRAGDGTVDRVPSDDTILGFLPGIRYSARKLDVEPGDVVVLYTDGVTEAANARDEMFTEERLEQVIADLGSCSAQEILDGIYVAVSDFRDGASGSDDVTVVVIQCTLGGADR